MTVAAEDYSRGSRLWQQPSRWVTIAVNDRRSDDCRIDGCRDDANLLMVVAIDECRSNDRRGE